MEFLSFDVSTKKLSLEKCAIPKPKTDEVLIKVSYSGICGTDLHILDVRRYFILSTWRRVATASLDLKQSAMLDFLSRIF